MTTPLPPAELRWGGARLQDDGRFLRSAHDLAAGVDELIGLAADSRLVDIGCGPGRLLIGILEHLGPIGRYVGIDTYEPVVEWASGALGEPAVSFRLVSLYNERYNTGGFRPTEPGFLPAEDGEFDRACLHSVFSHMRLPDIGLYLAETRRLVETGGRVYCTAFVEDGVPDETENPEGYGGPWQGPLHCVRLNREVFERLARDQGFEVERSQLHPPGSMQSRYGLLAV